MTDMSRLLDIAVEDNIAWCSRICAAHGSHEARSPAAWANLGLSPPNYPNIITRKKGVQPEVDELTRRVRKTVPSRRWGIKDSFAELALADDGFERLLAGHWYGGTVATGAAGGWQRIADRAGLRSWETAWGSRDDGIFPESLLEDRRVTFWFKGKASAIEAGFISFDSGFSLGISNWFSLKAESFVQLRLLQAAGSVSRGLPIVCWSTDDLAGEETGLAELGPMQVWLSR